MNYSIAEFYINEQEEWKDSIEFYLEYIDETEEWLNEITRYDTVIHLAAKVEHHLNQLQVSKLDFFRQQSGIEVLKKQPASRKRTDIRRYPPAAENLT